MPLNIARLSHIKFKLIDFLSCLAHKIYFDHYPIIFCLYLKSKSV